MTGGGPEAVGQQPVGSVPEGPVGPGPEGPASPGPEGPASPGPEQVAWAGAGRFVGAVAGGVLFVASIVAWLASPVLTALLVAASAGILTGWQIYRKRHGIPPAAMPAWMNITVPLLFGGLATIALNGWIFTISVGADGRQSNASMIVGLMAGVVAMGFAYGYGRVRAQRAQQNEVVEPGDSKDIDGEDVDPNEWLRNFHRDG